MFFDTVTHLLRRNTASAPETVAPDCAIAVAVQLMNRRRIGAVLVCNGSGLEGILTERDILQRVIEPGRDVASTAVADVMTRDPTTIGAGERAARALELMSRGGFRHLPVVEGAEVRGVLCERDLNAWMVEELRAQADSALMAVKSLGIANRGR